MRLLQITKKFPFPLKDGESIAVNNLAIALRQKDWQLDLLTMNTSKHPVETQMITDELKHYQNIYHQEVDNKVTLIGAFMHLLKGRSYQAERFIDPDFRDLLIRVLQENKYDVIQLESPYLAPYISTIRQHSSAHVSMRAHNVEHVIWERLAAHTSWGFKKWYFRKVANELKTLEKNYFAHYDSMIAISEHDKDTFERLGFEGPIISIPIGLNMDKYQINQPPAKPASLCFIGTLDWLPNLQGLEWFLKNVWPTVIKIENDVPFYIAGRGANVSFKKLAKQAPNCHFEGEVEHADEFLDQHPIMIVPLLSGSGIRVKIIEGMAKGMLVITTKCGMEGIPARHMHNILVAEDGDKFATLILYALNHPQDVEKIRRNARKFAAQEYDMHKKGMALDQFYRQNIPSEKEMPEPIITFES